MDFYEVGFGDDCRRLSNRATVTAGETARE
jgi:hypothetical protein